MVCLTDMKKVIIFFICCCCCSGDETATATTTEQLRCTEKELEQFSQEYEQCHKRALSQLQAERPNLDSEQESPGTRMSNSALCAALNTLIEDCTVILGWCFSSEDVNQTKTKQKELLKFALARMIPDFISSGECFEGTLIDKTKPDIKNETEQREIEKVLEKVQDDLLVSERSSSNPPTTTTTATSNQSSELVTSTTTATTTSDLVTTTTTSTATTTEIPIEIATTTTTTTTTSPTTTPVATTTTTTTTTASESTTTAAATTTTTTTTTTLEQTSSNPLTEDKFETYENEIGTNPDIPGPFPGQRPLREYRAQRGSGTKINAIFYLYILSLLNIAFL